ncbi:MAG: hypothetical protein AAFY45_34545, partial [Bacteroidota bacterium]
MEKESFSLAKKGLKMGMSDLIQMVNGQSEAFKKELNELLIASDLPSLKRLNAQIKNIAQKVLKRGEIKSESEYYIIKEVLIDLSLKLPRTAALAAGWSCSFCQPSFIFFLSI